MRGAALALLLLLAGCGGDPTTPAARDSALVRVNEDEVKSLDPQSISDLTSLRVTGDLYEGLTRIGADGRVGPGLASGWTISADGRLWRFALRPGLRFSDGQPITTGVVAASFARLRDDATAAPTSSLFDAIESLTAAGPDAVEVRLAKPFPALLELLAHPAAAVLPMHRIAADPDGWTKSPPSSGAYRLDRWELHSRMRLTANPNYWDAANVRAPAVTYLPVDDDQTAIRLFRSGEADTIGDFPSSQLPLLRARVGDAVRIAPYRGSYYWVFNTRKAPFDDRRVRLALALAVDRAKITEKLLGVGNPPSLSVVPPGLGGYPGVQPMWADWPMERRLAEARRLLTAAGYGPSRPLVIEARFNSDVDHRRVGIALASFWKPLGVELRLLNTEATLHFAALRTGDFMLARSGWIGDLDAAENFLAIYRSDTGALNYSGYANPAYDAALDAGLAEADPRLRNAKLARAEAILLADMPVLPLYIYVSKNLVSPRLDGWRDNLANAHPTRTLAVAK